jgi:hypothetical protein
MGEAWFMSEHRLLFDDLLGDLTLLSAKDLHKPLEEIASGTASLGPLDEWTDWYHYLLAQLIPRSHYTHIEALLEILITGFITQHPDGPRNEPYAGFFADALDTLGRCLMDQTCWPDGEIDVEACLSPPDWGEPWCLSYASGKLSASMFFCLKYLAPDEIAPWLKSVLSIPNTYWRAALIAWLVGAHGLLYGRIRQLSELQETATPEIGWDWSHCLKGNYTGDYTGQVQISDFLPEENRRAAIGAVRSAVTETVFLEWLASIARNENLAFELDDLPFRFWELYGRTVDRPEV